MVGFSRLTVLGAIIPLALAAIPSVPRPATALRLVKTSDEDPGTWMTEEEKFEKLTSKRIGFMDITDTMSNCEPGTRGNGRSPKGRQDRA
ncbi:hypothetical protein NUW58_g10647 [Xylaria curta]|uniref:Uncharacterized protein n=1 Tax=Xylaria curta TaxID=42375 RepID=A0ACC1MIL1_9PEZI|nr:hypothetical protein NUW58_g10647 [Xylaria curta]